MIAYSVDTFDTMLACARHGQSGKGFRYIQGELPSHYPLPSTVVEPTLEYTEYLDGTGLLLWVLERKYYYHPDGIGCASISRLVYQYQKGFES